MEILDITTVTTIKQLKTIDFSKYLSETLDDFQWIKYIKYPISQEHLDRICELSKDLPRKRLVNTMGDLFILEK